MRDLEKEIPKGKTVYDLIDEGEEIEGRHAIYTNEGIEYHIMVMGESRIAEGFVEGFIQETNKTSHFDPLFLELIDE